MIQDRKTKKIFCRDQHDLENDLKCKASKKFSVRISQQTVSNRNRETAVANGGLQVAAAPAQKKRQFLLKFCRHV